MYAPGVSVLKRMTGTLREFYSYQLGFLVSTLLLGAPAIVAVAIYWQAAWPSLLTASAAFILTHAAVVLKDIEESELESFTEYELRYSLAETLGLLALLAMYTSTTLAIAIGLDQLAASTVPALYVWTALAIPLVDVYLLRHVGVSPGAVPANAVLFVLHLAGRLNRIDPNTISRYGQRGRSA